MNVPPRLTVWIAGVIVLLSGFFFYYVQFGELFPLVEYRGWMQGKGVLDWLTNWLKMVFFLDPQVPFSRSFSILTVTVVSALFGTSITAHNVVQLALLTTPAACLVWTIGRSSLKGLAAGILAAAFFLFSIPVVDAASWQATSLDKIAVFFCGVTIVYATFGRPKGDNLKRIAIFNTILLILYACVYNAKEAAWGVAPVVSLLVFFKALASEQKHGGTRILNAGLRSLKLTGLPLLWATVHVFRLYITILHTPGADRLVGGDIGYNVSVMVGYLTDQQVGEYGALVAIVMIVLGGIVSSLNSLHENSRFGAIICALVGLFLACTIPARAAGVSPFYLLVAVFFLALSLGHSVAAILCALRPALVANATLALLSILMTLQIAEYWKEAAYFREVASYTPHFHQTLRVLRNGLFDHKPNTIAIVYSDAAKRGYMFTEQIGLARFILPIEATDEEFAALDRIISTSAKSLRPDISAKPGELLILLDDRMGPKHVEFGRL